MHAQICDDTGTIQLRLNACEIRIELYSLIMRI